MWMQKYHNKTPYFVQLIYGNKHNFKSKIEKERTERRKRSD
jgi:hypothetical protein